MAEYTTSELNQLVSDGIKTIEFIQQAAKNPKETYGRSAIQKPATRDRIKAWEGIAGEHDYSGGKPDDEKRGGEGVKEEEGKGNHQVARRSRRRKRGTPVKIESSSEVSDRENGDGENSPTGDSTVGRPPDTGLPGTGEKGDSGSGGDTKHERSIGDDSVSNEDFRVVLSADHESSALETTGSSPAVSNVREATTEDFAQIFDEGPSKIHRRLTGIAAYAGSSQPKGSADHPVKKGHRREYCIDTFGGRTIIREWCNPQCAPVTATPAQFACSCGECPRRCVKCIDDRIYLAELRNSIA
ncbi:V protein [Ninove microtus virus]|uniref:Non-structural protein V n=1 Tax=Ninove microtus virus TaxID=2940990 RepID=A0AAE9HT78_9MONO|nr:V protein [Ninove microtus virus]